MRGREEKVTQPETKKMIRRLNQRRKKKRKKRKPFTRRQKSCL